MKKLIFVMIFVCSLFVPGFSAGFGGGVRLDCGTDFAAGDEINFELDGLPFVFSAAFETDRILCGGEYKAFNFNLYKALNLNLGPSVCFGYDFSVDKIIVENGFFTGLNGFFLPAVDFYTELGWTPELLFGKDCVNWRLCDFAVKCGLRWWTD